MEPSHTRRYSRREVEVEAAKILHELYGAKIKIPIAIDLITEKHELVDDLIPVELLEDKFKVAAALVSKRNGRCDILVDEDTITFQEARANFSIAHELGHVVLHPKLYGDCDTIEESILLKKRIKNVYSRIEREAHNFAEALLMPRETIFNHTSKIYEVLVRKYGYDSNLIIDKTSLTLACLYHVTKQPMDIRLERLGLIKKIKEALGYESPYLDP